MHDCVVLTDLNGIVLDVNKAAIETFGYRKEDVIGRNGLDLIAPEDRERATNNIALSVAGSEIVGLQDYLVLAKDGRRLNAEITVRMLADSSGRPYGFITVIRDVTEKKRVEAALRESEKQYRIS
jgi:PAS domain S-box-containing protein